MLLVAQCCVLRSKFVFSLWWRRRGCLITRITKILDGRRADEYFQSGWFCGLMFSVFVFNVLWVSKCESCFCCSCFVQAFSTCDFRAWISDYLWACCSKSGKLIPCYLFCYLNSVSGLNSEMSVFSLSHFDDISWSQLLPDLFWLKDWIFLGLFATNRIILMSTLPGYLDSLKVWTNLFFRLLHQVLVPLSFN